MQRRGFLKGRGFDFGNALLYDGSNDFVTFGGSNVLTDPNSAWSFGGWFNLTNFSNPFPIIARLKSGVVNNPFSIFFSNDGFYKDISFGSSSTFINRKITIPSFSLGQYYHIIITYNGNNPLVAANFKIYVNAAEISTASVTGIANSSDSSRLSEAGLPFVGKQDEVSFWQQELTLLQVQNQYRNGKGNEANFDVNPLVWFKMNETSGNSIAVNSGSGGSAYNGTLNNFNTSTCWVSH